MTPIQIIVLVVCGLLAGAAAFFLLSWRYSEKHAPKITALGTVVGWQDVKLPMMGRAVIQYSKKGKPMQAQSGLTLRSRKPKIGMKRMWTISAYKTKDKQTVYIAKKAKL